MPTFAFLVLYFLQLMFHGDFSMQDWEYAFVDNCPQTETEWNVRSQSQRCTMYTTYHCFMTTENRLAEICVEMLALDRGKCPILNLSTASRPYYALSVCEKEGCPKRPYLTHELFRYPSCYQWFNGSHRDIETTVITSEKADTTPPFSEKYTLSFPAQTMPSAEEVEIISATLSQITVLCGGVLSFVACIIIFSCHNQRKTEIRQREQLEALEYALPHTSEAILNSKDDVDIYHEIRERVSRQVSICKISKSVNGCAVHLDEKNGVITLNCAEMKVLTSLLTKDKTSDSNTQSSHIVTSESGSNNSVVVRCAACASEFAFDLSETEL